MILVVARFGSRQDNRLLLNAGSPGPRKPNNSQSEVSGRQKSIFKLWPPVALVLGTCYDEHIWLLVKQESPHRGRRGIQRRLFFHILTCIFALHSLDYIPVMINRQAFATVVQKNFISLYTKRGSSQFSGIGGLFLRQSGSRADDVGSQFGQPS